MYSTLSNNDSAGSQLPGHDKVNQEASESKEHEHEPEHVAMQGLHEKRRMSIGQSSHMKTRRRSGLRVQINSTPTCIDDTSSQHIRDKTPLPGITNLGPRIATILAIESLLEGSNASQAQLCVERALKTLTASPGISDGALQEVFSILDDGLFLGMITRSSILVLVDRAPASKNGVTYAPGSKYAERTAILLGRCFFLELAEDVRPEAVLKALVHQMIHAYLLATCPKPETRSRKDARLDHGKYFCAIQFAIKGVMSDMTHPFKDPARSKSKQDSPYSRAFDGSERRSHVSNSGDKCTSCTKHRASISDPTNEFARWLEGMRQYFHWSTRQHVLAFGIKSRYKTVCLENNYEKPADRYEVLWREYSFLYPKNEIEERFPDFAKRWSLTYERVVEIPESVDFIGIEPLLTFLKAGKYETPNKRLRESLYLSPKSTLDAFTKGNMFEDLEVDIEAWFLGEQLGFPEIQSYAEQRIIWRGHQHEAVSESS